MPHPLVLLTGFVVLSAASSYVVPAGAFDRRDDPATGRSVVVAGSYEEVEPSPVGPFDAMVALPRGMIEAGDVIFLVFLIGGAFAVVDESGTLGRAVAALAHALRGRDLVIIPVVALLFATGGVIENMQEEIVPLIPVLLVLAGRVGFTPMVAVAMSAGAAFVGSAFSPINPFQVQIAQQLAALPLLSGGGFRLVFLALALALWIGATIRYAARTRVPVTAESAAGAAGAGPPPDAARDRLTARDQATLSMVAVTFIILVFGLLRLGWGFNEMSAAFFIMGCLVGLAAGMGVSGTAEAYVRGFQSMAYAALLIGFARAIFVVLDDGRIIDTLVHALFTPLSELPPVASALGMIGAHALIHVPVPSVSGQAVLTMPLLVPLSDLLGLSRQVTVLAYQYGAGLCDLITPTNGALMAVLATAGVRWDQWMRFAGPLYLALVALGGASVWVAVAIGLQ
jgi:uncharacterized ion transporter superfamily protein YfcC